MKGKANMATRGLKIGLAVLALAAWAGPARAQDVGANSSGNWETASIWTTNSVPGASNNVYIGSTYPGGAAATATVTLTANEVAKNLNLGFGNGTSGTLNLGSKALTVSGEVLLGIGGTGSITEGAGGSFTAASLYSSASSITFGANDAVGYLQIENGSAATTSATGNVTSNGSIYVISGSTLTLGAALNISGALSVQDSGSTLSANGHGITSNQLYVGWNGSSAASLTNAGPVTTTDLYVGNGSSLTLHGGDVVNSLIDLKGGSTLTVQEVGGTGLTLNGTSLSSLTIDPSSMDLIFTLNSTPNWDFRWQDPSSGGNWIGTIDGMISSGAIQITAPNGYTVDDRGGYTYIDGVPNGVVPEPSSVIMLSLGALGVLGAMAARRRAG